MFKPIERKSLSRSVFEQLSEQILRGALSPGDNLPGERSLSDVLGVNRGAVREALKRLEQARLGYLTAGFDYLSAYFDWQMATGRGAELPSVAGR